MLINPVERYMKNEGIKEGKKEGIKEGKKEGKREIAEKLIEDGHPIEYVIKISGLSKKDILK